MTKTAQDLLEEALKLDVSQRADLAAELLASLDGEPEDQVEAAWAAEIQRRIDRIEAGTEKLLPWEDVKRRIDKEILGR
jgi:putative addiction module component (TIGR02574 family)